MKVIIEQYQTPRKALFSGENPALKQFYNNVDCVYYVFDSASDTAPEEAPYLGRKPRVC